MNTNDNRKKIIIQTFKEVLLKNLKIAGILIVLIVIFFVKMSIAFTKPDLTFLIFDMDGIFYYGFFAVALYVLPFISFFYSLHLMKKTQLRKREKLIIVLLICGISLLISQVTLRILLAVSEYCRLNVWVH